MSDASPNIYQRMLLLMEEVQYVQKENKRVNNQYTFVSHDAVTAKVRQAALKCGIYIRPTVTEWGQENNRTSCSMDVAYINVDSPEDRISVSSFGFGIDNQDKGPGKAMSYAFKYNLLKALSLETGDDPENDDVDFKDPASEIKSLALRKEIDLGSILEHFGVNVLEDLSEEQQKETKEILLTK